MFQHQGMWLPDGEKHFPEWMNRSGEIVDGRGTYQIKKWRACVPFIKDWSRAVDVGAHVGFWAMQMAKRFEYVYCFEPMEQFRACIFENLYGLGNYCVHPIALGAGEGRVSLAYDLADSGGTHVTAGDDVELKTLDSFGFESVGFLKIDCEGYEVEVLKGAAQTLERCKPCVIVEQKPHKLEPNFGIKGTPAVELLLAMGAKQRAVLSGDYILSWD